MDHHGFQPHLEVAKLEGKYSWTLAEKELRAMVKANVGF